MSGGIEHAAVAIDKVYVEPSVCVCTCFATLRGQSVHRAFVGTCLSFGDTKHQSIDQMLPLIVSLASNSYSWVHEFLDYASLSRALLKSTLELILSGR